MSTRLSSEDRRVWVVIGVIALLGVLFVPFSQLVLDVTYTYTVRTVALGGSILGVVSGVLGCFAVLRHESLMGDALSHAALPGVAVAFLIAGRELSALLIGAGIASWIGVQFIRSLLNTTRIKQDTAMGIVLAAWFAAGIALLAYIQARPDASQAGLDEFIFGQAASMVESDVRLIAIVGTIAFVVLAVFWKEFKLVTFDPAFAGANGFRVNFFNALLSTLIVIAIVLGLQLAGVILMVGMLIAPGIAARQWTQKLGQMVILSAVFGAFAGGTGAIISAVDANIPTGPMIIVVAFAVVLISIGFAPGRGLVWTLLRQRGDSRRFAAQTTLRDLYRYAQSHGSIFYPVPDAFITGVGGSNASQGLRELEKRGHVQHDTDSWILTQAGVDAAEADMHNQQLWETYRTYGDELDLPLVMEDRQKDIHDVLPQPAVEKLERKLKGAPA
ncbi:MAG: metal ABC transporter permease [Chloroflexota bacterium]